MSDLDRIVDRWSREEICTLAHKLYEASESFLLLDNNHNLFFASRKAEQDLGYTLDQIRLDTKRFQTETKQSFDEIAMEAFAQGKGSLKVRNVLYRSTDKKYNILMNLHVQRLADGGLCVQLSDVARHETSKRPGMFQYRYKRAVCDQTVIVNGYVDQRNDQNFLDQVNTAYLNASGQKGQLVIDLSRATGIMPDVIHSLSSKQNILFLNPNETMFKELLEAGIPFERIQHYDSEGSPALSPAPAK